MLASEKIARAFTAICEEAEKLKQETSSEAIRQGLKTIVSIARHQSDIRGAESSSCRSHKTC